MTNDTKERKLTEAEQRRLDHFNGVCEELVSQGYTRINLTVSVFWASVAAIVGLLVLLLIALPCFLMMHPEVEFVLELPELVIFIVALVALIVVHELIHGITWSVFASNGFKDIDFGIMWDSLTPYCTCAAPLEKGPYILGALMPMVVLGIIPTIVAFVTGSMLVLYLGIIMIDAAAGDVMIVAKILRHKSESAEMLIYDHPTEAGSVIFER